MIPGPNFSPLQETRLLWKLAAAFRVDARPLTARQLAGLLPPADPFECLGALAALEAQGLCDAWISGDGSRDLIDRIAFGAALSPDMAAAILVAERLPAIFSPAELAEIKARARLRREIGAAP